jgi:hypothetical protein
MHFSILVDHPHRQFYLLVTGDAVYEIRYWPDDPIDTLSICLLTSY